MHPSNHTYLQQNNKVPCTQKTKQKTKNPETTGSTVHIQQREIEDSLKPFMKNRIRNPTKSTFNSI